MITSSLKLPEPAERSSKWEWARVGVLASNLVWTTACLGGYLERTLVVTSVLGAALLVVHWVGGLRERGLRSSETSNVSRSHPAGWLLLPFLGYAAVNAAWFTPVAWLGWMDWLGWAQMAVVFWVVLNGIRSSQAIQALIFVLAGLGAVLVALAIYQRFAAPSWLMLNRTQARQFLGRASGTFGQPNNLAAFLVLIGPIVGARVFATGRTAIIRIVWAYIAAGFAFALILTISRGAWLALSLAMLVAPLFWMRGSGLRRIAVTLTLAAAVTAAGWVLVSTVPAIRHRVAELQTNRGELSRPILWRAAWNLFRAHPTVGTGAGSFGVLLDRHRPEQFQLEARWAHSDYLNTLSDYGGIGFVLCFGACGVIALGCRRRPDPTARMPKVDRALTVGLWVGVVAFGAQLAVDSSLKTPALAMTFAAIAGLLVQRQWRLAAQGTNEPKRASALPVILGSALVAGVLLLFVGPLYRAEAIRQEARGLIDRHARERLALTEESLQDARARLVKASQLSPINGRVWSDLSYVTGLLGRFHAERVGELGREAEAFARKAIGRGAPVSEFWVRLGVALDLQERWVEAGAAMARAIELSPTRASVWYHQAFHLGLSPVHQNEALAAAALSLRLDPASPEAHALREQLAERSRAP